MNVCCLWVLHAICRNNNYMYRQKNTRIYIVIITQLMANTVL